MANRVIFLTTTPQPVLSEDAKAAEAILPGHLVTLDSSGDAIKHAVAGGAAVPRFADYREAMGKSIDTPYAVNDTVKIGTGQAGIRVNAWIASGQNIAKGALLESAGNGTLRVFGSGVVIAQALEAVNASAAAARIRVELA